MRRNWEKTIWIASKIASDFDDYGNEITQYDTPKQYKFNVQPVSSEADIEEFGENAKEMQKAVISRKKYEGKFKEFDKAYLDGQTPLGELITVQELNAMSVKNIDTLSINKSTGILGISRKEKKNGEYANYRLYPPRNQNKAIVIYFERLTAK